MVPMTGAVLSISLPTRSDAAPVVYHDIRAFAGVECSLYSALEPWTGERQHVPSNSCSISCYKIKCYIYLLCFHLGPSFNVNDGRNCWRG